jgi:hypothetical protein
MPTAPITTAAPINQQTGLVLAYFGYDRSTTPESELKAKLDGSGWISIDSPTNASSNLTDILGTGYNTQLGADGKVENSFNVFVNEATNQIVFSFKGSDVASNFKSDLVDNGKTEYQKIEAQAAMALTDVRALYPGYTVVTVGHSLGGGMAQSFAIKNGLSAQVYNSLPISRQLIDSGYFGSPGSFDAQLQAWKAAGNTIDVVSNSELRLQQANSGWKSLRSGCRDLS